METKTILDEAAGRVEMLMQKESCPPREFPEKRGVYLIRDKEGKVIYVGKAKKLRRRINSDHISGDLDMGTSTFRRKLAKRFPDLTPGKQMREWILKNCAFTFVEVENSDLCNLVEALAITIARKENPDLLND